MRFLLYFAGEIDISFVAINISFVPISISTVPINISFVERALSFNAINISMSCINISMNCISPAIYAGFKYSGARDISFNHRVIAFNAIFTGIRERTVNFNYVKIKRREILWVSFNDIFCRKRR